jgi:hypothetical protein
MFPLRRDGGQASLRDAAAVFELPGVENAGLNSFCRYAAKKEEPISME